jgi:hypothetical protein
MNMQQMGGSRKTLKAGNVFTFHIGARGYGYGRIVRTDVDFGGDADTILIYIYNRFDTEPDHNSILSPRQLLLPPILTNRLPWSRGYFTIISSCALSQDDILPVHCFWDVLNEKHVNENGKKLARKIEPCGIYALDSFRTIDRAISEALGIPPSPDTLPIDR